MNYGRYRIVSELGRGGMGMVYQGHDPQIDRMVALKVLREDRLTTEDFVQRFLKEATAIGRLSHPGIVTVYDVGQDHGTIYIAMEFLEGQSVDELVKAGTLSLPEIVDMGIQIANALHYAHERGIVHRDIKPPNIIYTPEKTIKVTDFGIAHIDDPDRQQMTRAGEILGTPVYMAPEQVLGQAVDGRSDLYSLGVILYELSTGRRPFQGENLAAVFHAITQDDPLPPDQLNPDIPPAFSQLILKSMAKNPADRFTSGQELANHLAHCLERQPESPPTEFHDEQLTNKKRSGKSLLVVAGLLIIVGVLSAFLYFGIPGKEKSTQAAKTTAHDEPSQISVLSDENIRAPEPVLLDTLSEKSEPDTKPAGIDEKPTKKIVSEPKSMNVFPDLSPSPVLTGTTKKESILSQQEEKFFGDLFKEDRGDISKLPEIKPSPPQEQRDVDSVKPVTSAETKPVADETGTLLPLRQKQNNSNHQKTAMLTISSSPAGASLYIDGKYRGITPQELTIPAKKHEVKLELQGHLGWQAQLNLSKGGNVPLSIPLLKE